MARPECLNKLQPGLSLLFQMIISCKIKSAEGVRDCFPVIIEASQTASLCQLHVADSDSGFHSRTICTSGRQSGIQKEQRGRGRGGGGGRFAIKVGRLIGWPTGDLSQLGIFVQRCLHVHWPCHLSRPSTAAGEIGSFGGGGGGRSIKSIAISPLPMLDPSLSLTFDSYRLFAFE